MDLEILVADRANIGFDIAYSPLERFGSLTILDNATALADTLAQLSPAVVVANRPQFDAAALTSWRNTSPEGRRLICLTATGTNTVDLSVARAQGIAVCNVVGYSTDSVAQHTLALVLGLLNRVESRDRQARQWPQTAVWTDLASPIHELAGKTWGIIGMGAIGRRVATLAAAFGCQVIWTSTSASGRREAWPHEPLEEMLAKSDIVSIHSPITDLSRNLIDARSLQLMKPTALLVNVGRGGIINEADLASCLKNGHLAGAALDVLAPEPPSVNNALFNINSDRLILTPHVAWASVEARQRVIVESALNIESWLAGQQRNRVD